MMLSRNQQFQALFPAAPAYRWRQIEAGLFNPAFLSFDSISNVPAEMRQALTAFPWLTIAAVTILESARKDTYKAVIKLADDTRVETVLMANVRGAWTICVSSQVGCAMGCTFCATGKMGLIRNLTSDEIIDQYRFWRQWLNENDRADERISNIVFMGMGEPLANYDNVKTALHTLLAHTDLGPTHITVSSVGVLPFLERILKDKDWPAVRIAISLHSADAALRKRIVPTTQPEFLPKLADWVRRYFEAYPGRRRHMTFEYILLENVNDRPEDANALGRFSAAAGRVKVNVIPYNSIGDATLHRSNEERITSFMETVKKHGVLITRRKTMGDDIAAACGQLIAEQTRN